MAISDVLLEGGKTFKTYLDRGKGGGGGVGLKSEYFRADVIYEWSLTRKIRYALQGP